MQNAHYARSWPTKRFPPMACNWADQERPEAPQQSHSVTKLAAAGQLLMAASGQVPMTADNPASIKPGYLQDASRGHTVYLLVYREPPLRPRVLRDEAASVG